MADLVNVNVKIGEKTQNIQIEKGVTFENKGGIYTVDENGQLKKFDKKANVWTDASKIEMTNYQWKAFQNVSNNDGDAKSYTKADIEKAQEMYRKGEFTADMSNDLPAGYKIEKPKLDSKQGMVQVYVTNGKEKQSATLKFQIQEIAELKAASQAREAEQAQKAEGNKPVTETTKTEETEETKATAPPKALVGADQKLVDKYTAQFKDIEPKDIAQTLAEQIKGLSNGEKTLSMFDAIPKDKLMEVIDLYQENTKEPLFTAMSNELGIGGDELKARINAYVDYCVNIPGFNKNGVNLNKLSDAVEKLDMAKVNEGLYKVGQISAMAKEKVEENELYGNYTVKTETDEDVIKRTYSDGSYSIEEYGSSKMFSYTEYYPNGKKKYERDYCSLCSNTETIYDENGKILYAWDNSGYSTGRCDEPTIRTDAKGRTIYEENGITGEIKRIYYDDKNKTVTIVKPSGKHKEKWVYTMTPEGNVGPDSRLLSNVFIGETGREIDLLNYGFEDLCNELKIRPYREYYD